MKIDDYRQGNLVSQDQTFADALVGKIIDIMREVREMDAAGCALIDEAEKRSEAAEAKLRAIVASWDDFRTDSHVLSCVAITGSCACGKADALRSAINAARDLCDLDLAVTQPL